MKMFDDAFPSISIQELSNSLGQMREDIQAGADQGDESFREEAAFLLAILNNLDAEIKGVTDLEGLEINKKVRVIAFMNLFYECLSSTYGDEMGDDEFEDDEDEDEQSTLDIKKLATFKTDKTDDQDISSK